jgi:phage shock protein C
MNSTPGSRRPLQRSATNRMLGGVAGGIADYLGVDATVIRIAFVLLTLFGGSGGLLYIIAVIIMPVEGEGESMLDRWRHGH